MWGKRKKKEQEKFLKVKSKQKNSLQWSSYTKGEAIIDDENIEPIILNWKIIFDKAYAVWGGETSEYILKEFNCLMADRHTHTYHLKSNRKGTAESLNFDVGTNKNIWASHPTTIYLPKRKYNNKKRKIPLKILDRFL